MVSCYLCGVQCGCYIFLSLTIASSDLNTFVLFLLCSLVIRVLVVVVYVVIVTYVVVVVNIAVVTRVIISAYACHCMYSAVVPSVL